MHVGYKHQLELMAQLAEAEDSRDWQKVVREVLSYVGSLERKLDTQKRKLNEKEKTSVCNCDEDRSWEESIASSKNGKIFGPG